MGEGLYVAARVLMWLCFLALPFSPFLLMIEDPLLRFTLFGTSIGLELLLLFTGCSLKIFNHWREQKIEKILEREGYAPSQSPRSSVQLENSTEVPQSRRRSSVNSLLQNEKTPSAPNDNCEQTVRTPTVRFDNDKEGPNFTVAV